MYRYLLAIDDPKDLEDYLQGLLDVEDPKANRFIQELLQKKQGTALPENITVYKKPAEDRDYVSKSSKSQSRSKAKEKKPGGFSKVDLSTVNRVPRMPGDVSQFRMCFAACNTETYTRHWLYELSFGHMNGLMKRFTTKRALKAWYI